MPEVQQLGSSSAFYQWRAPERVRTVLFLENLYRAAFAILPFSGGKLPFRKIL